MGPRLIKGGIFLLAVAGGFAMLLLAMSALNQPPAWCEAEGCYAMSH